MANRFWVLGSGTWDNSTQGNWATSSGGSPTGIAPPTSADTVIFDGNSGAAAVITVNANVTALTVALGTTGGNFTGTLDFATHNNSPTFGNFAFSGAGTRTLNLGTGTFTLNGSVNNLFDLTTNTGLTFSGAGATLLCSTNSTGARGINLSGQTLGTVSITGVGAGSGFSFTQTGGETITNLNVSSPNLLLFTPNKTLIITNAPTWSGTVTSPLLISNSFSTFNGAQATLQITTGAPSLNYTTLYGIVFTGTVGTATNTISYGVNSGITVSSPSAGTGGGIING